MKDRILQLAHEGLSKADIARECRCSWAYVHQVLAPVSDKVKVRRVDSHKPIFTRDEFEDQIRRYGSITNIHAQNALVRGWDWANINSLYRLAKKYELVAPAHARKKVTEDGTWKWW